MVNDWLRLWHELPNDPKWRTIARVSGHRIGDVIALYIHLLVDASERSVTQCDAEERGVTQANAEDLASALDIEKEDVEAILSAMEGRVIENGYLTGWDKRQPKREDSSADRTQKWRERKKNTPPERNVTQCDASERNVTLEKRREEKIYKDSLPLTREAENYHIPDVGKNADADHVGDDAQSSRIRQVFVPPAKEQVLMRFAAIGRPECGQEFYEHWAGVFWKDAQGRHIDWTVKIGKWLRDQPEFDQKKSTVNARGSPAKQPNTLVERSITNQAELNKIRGIPP